MKHKQIKATTQVFEQMLDTDSKTWNSIIRAYCADFKHNEALSFYIQKRRCSLPFKPDHLVLSALFKSCAAISLLNFGKSLHTYVVKLGHISCTAVCKSVLNMYAKCQGLNDCKNLFGEMMMSCNGDPVGWNILLSGFSKSGFYDFEVMKLFSEMVRRNEAKLNEVTFAVVLPVCARLRDLPVGKGVHCCAVKSGLEAQTLVGNSLVSMYAKCGFVRDDAYTAFSRIVYKDVVSWNAIIAGYIENNLQMGAFDLFRKMLNGHEEPNYATIASILPVCASLRNDASHCYGKDIHGYVLKRSPLIEDVTVINAFISFYLRTGLMKEAEILFRGMGIRDLVSWNAIIAGYASNDDCLGALKLFREFLCMSMVRPDYITLVSVLPACAHLYNLKAGKEIHCHILRNPALSENTTLGNALISFYAKLYDIDAALRAFLMVNDKDLISWNTILDAFSESGNETQFTDLLRWMFKDEYKPDSITILSIIHFSTTASNVKMVKETHCFSLKMSLLEVDIEPTVGNAILDAYAKCDEMAYAYKIFECLSNTKNVITCNSMISGYLKCGSHEDAYTLFKQMSQSDITTWNLMIRVYAENNFPSHALSLFLELQDKNMKPDALTIMSILPVCAQMVSSELLSQCHGYMTRACFDDVQLTGAFLDLYSKCGNLNSAYSLFLASPQKDLVMFTSMVGGYAMHGMGDEALKMFTYMLELDVKPDNVIITSVLSACSHAGLIDDGLKLFDSIEKLHGMKPTIEQYACVVDLLARGGRIKEAYSFVDKMPIKANANIWGTLLGACKTYHEFELGRDAANRLFEIESKNIGNYVVISNIYAAEKKWDKVVEIRKMMKGRELKKPAGCSWIDVENRKNIFIAGDYSHPQRGVIYDTLSSMDQQIKEPLYI